MQVAQATVSNLSQPTSSDCPQEPTRCSRATIAAKVTFGFCSGAGYAVLLPYTASPAPAMLQRVFEVLVPIIQPIAANEGDVIVCTQYPDGRAFLSVHRNGDDLQRRVEMKENKATGLLFAAMNDDAINEVDLTYCPPSVFSAEPPPTTPSPADVRRRA